MSNTLNEMQQLRLLLIKWSNFDLVETEKMYNFIINDKPKTSDIPIVNEQPKIFDTPVVKDRPDGIYFILSPNNVIHESLATDEDKLNSIAVGVKMGSKFANVTLNDVAGGSKVALCVDNEYFDKIKIINHSEFYDVISDWNGIENTNKLRNNLNPDINLSKDEYIPSMAQLFLIMLNIKDINKALEEAGGTPIKEKWYWSSTDDSEVTGWIVSFEGGCDFVTKFYDELIRTSVICEFDNIN